MTKLSEQIQSLLTYANGVTGEEDTTLGDAVRTLAEGYGGDISLLLNAYGIPSSNLSLASANYTFVEYLESTGTQYINTEIIPSSLGYKIVFKKESNGFICGSRTTANTGRYCPIFDSSNSKFVFFYNNSQFTIGNCVYNKYINFTFENSFIGDITGSCPIYLFTINTNNTPYAGNFAITYIRLFCILGKIFLVPCLRKSDNTPLMLDLVTMKEYINQGEGDFLYGETVSLQSKIKEVYYKEQ